MTNQAPHRREHEQGMALLVTIFILFLIAGISMVSITHSGEEAAGSGRTRVAMRAFHAADAGIQFAANRIAQNPPKLDGLDRDIRPYQILKSTINDGRLDIPNNDILLRELNRLELDTKKGKVDHPPGGSKDLADALAGVVFRLSNLPKAWREHGVSRYKAAPGLYKFIRDNAPKRDERVEF